MPTSELDLWPDQISVDVVSPLALLRIQATALKRKTKGILDARVDSRDATMDIIVGYSEELDGPEPILKRNEKCVKHSLLVEAPVLGYTELVLTVFHSAGRYYPVYFDEQDQPSAHTQEEFIKLLRERLQSNDMLSTFQSIIAQSNEAKNSPSKK